MSVNSIVEFTIVIPVYNGEPYLNETIDSVLAQTYPHFEIVMLENGSTDNTVKIIESYSDERIRMISSDELLPIEENWARILTIENANEFLVLLCADDIILPTFLEEIVALIHQEPEATLYHTHAIFVDDNGKTLAKAKPAPVVESANEYINSLHEGNEDAFGSGYVMRFMDYQHVGGLPAFHRLLFADFYCYYLLTHLGYKACVQQSLVKFRFTSTGVTSVSSIQDLAISSQQYKRALLSHPNFVSHDLLEDFVTDFINRNLRIRLIRLIKSKKPDYDFLDSSTIVNFVSSEERAFVYDFPLSWYISLARIRNWIMRRLLLYILLSLFLMNKYRRFSGT